MNEYTKKLVTTNLSIVNQLLMAEQKDRSPEIEPNINMAMIRIEMAIEDLSKVKA